MFDAAITSGEALDKFRELIKHYSGAYEDYKHSSQRLLNGVAVSYITAKEDGYVNDVVLNNLTSAYKKLSRSKDYYDSEAGIVMLVREGDKIKANDKLMRVFYHIDNNNYFKVVNDLRSSVVITKTKHKTTKVFYKVVI